MFEWIHVFVIAFLTCNNYFQSCQQHQVIDYHALVRGRWHYRPAPKAIFLTDPVEHLTQFLVILMIPNAWKIVILVCKKQAIVIVQKLIISVLIIFIEFI